MLKNCGNQFKFGQFRNKMYYCTTKDHRSNKNKPQDFGKY